MNSNDFSIDHDPRSLPSVELIPYQSISEDDPSYAKAIRQQHWLSVWRFSQIPNFKRLYDSSTETLAGESLYSRCAAIINDICPRHNFVISAILILPSGDVQIRCPDFIDWFILNNDLPYEFTYHYVDPQDNLPKSAVVQLGYFN